MGSESPKATPLRPAARERSRSHRSLIVSAAAISLVALVACWFGTRSIIDGILNYEGRQVAAQWALAFAHTLAPDRTASPRGPLRSYSELVRAERLTALDNAMFAGEIVGYRIFNREGTVVAASEFLKIGSRTAEPSFRDVIENGNTHARLRRVGEGDGQDSLKAASIAIVPLVWSGRIHGAIGIDIDMSTRSEQLDQLRNLAMLCLATLLAAVTGIMGASVVRTLARRQQMESELYQQEEQYRRLLEHSRTAIVIHDGTSILYANAAAATVHGAPSKKELIGMDPVQLVPVENRTAMQEGQQSFFSSGAYPSRKIRGRRRIDGTVVDTEAFVSETLWDGRACIQVQSWDMSTEIEAQRAVAESEARLSALLENAPFAVSIKDTGYRFVVANRVYADLAGKTADEIVGRHVRDIFDAGLAAHLDALTRQVLETGNAIRFETLMPGAGSGGGRTLMIDKFPVRTPDGRIIGIADILQDITEERRRERKVVESEARLRGFLDYSSSVLYMKDTDLRMTLVNKRYEEFFDRPADAIIGRRVGSWMSGDAAALTAEQDRRVIESREAVSMEIDYRAADGRVRTVLSEKFPVFGPDGALLEIGGIHTDVTSLKEKEQESLAARLAAERAEQRLSAFLQHSPAGMYAKDTNLRITLVNRALEQFLGYPPGGLVGRTTGDFMPAPVAALIEAADRDILRNGNPVSVETEVLRGDGEVRTLVFEKFPIFSAEGVVIGIGGVNTDVTEERERHRATIESEALLSAFLDHAPFMTIFSAPDRALINVNRRYEAFFGIRNADVVGMKTRPWLPDGLETKYVSEHPSVMEPGALVERTTEMSNLEGELRALRHTKFPIVLPDGTTVAVGTILTDVTEQKEYERELENARDAAEEASRAKSTFLANMSHEIRTPMNGVLGMADILSQSNLNGDQSRLLGTLRRSGEALLGVINNVLDISRIEAGAFRLDVARFDLHEATADAVDLLAEAAAAKGIVIAHHVARDVPVWVSGDDVRLRQVMINLLGNAVKFTESGEVVIRLSRIGGTPSEPTIRFEVSDTGIGIPRDRQASLFGTFNQLDGSITRRYGGSGLGLSISQHIVDLMGGRIDVESQLGLGSSFVFAIPLAAAAPSVAPPAAAPGLLAGKRLLIVDDNRTNREILADFAAGWGMSHIGADSAEAAIAALDSALSAGRPFDAAVIDIVMPGTDGIALARRIRNERRFDRTKLIALTSFNWDRDSVDCRDAGFVHFATKPVRRRHLGDLIRSALDDGVVADETAPLPTALPAGNAAARDATVLIVEDNPVNREIAQQYLQQQGCRIRTAENGREAFALFSSFAFDLVLMDVQMPEIDGIEATRLMRSHEARSGSRRTPIIAVTAHAFREDREKCILAGMDDFLSKPYTRKELLPLLDRWLGPAKGGSDDAPAAPPPESPESAESSESPTSPDDGHLDAEMLLHLKALDPAGGKRILEKLVAMFFEAAPAQIGKLHAELRAGNGAEAGAIAHGLKSSAANVAATRLAGAFRNVELAAREGDIEACREAAGEIDDLAAAARRALEAAISAKPDPLRESA